MDEIIDAALDDLELLQDVFDQQVPNQQLRAQVWRRHRLDPMLEIPNNRSFKTRYQFSKVNVNKIVDMVSPFLLSGDNNQGLPSSPTQIVCTALEVLAAGHFFRVAGYSSGCSTSTSRNHLYRFVDAILQVEV